MDTLVFMFTNQTVMHVRGLAQCLFKLAQCLFKLLLAKYNARHKVKAQQMVTEWTMCGSFLGSSNITYIGARTVATIPR